MREFDFEWQADSAPFRKALATSLPASFSSSYYSGCIYQLEGLLVRKIETRVLLERTPSQFSPYPAAKEWIVTFPDFCCLRKINMSKYLPSLKNPSQSCGPGRQRRLSFFLWIRDCAIKSFHARGGLALAAAGLLPLSAGAADFTVDTLSDNEADGFTLREAIVLANGNSEADTIGFADGLTGILTLTQGQLQVSGDLTIEGPGQDLLTISGNNSSRIFEFIGGTSELSGLTLSDGNSEFDGNTGGAILVDSGAELTVLNSTISGNSATYGGGGIYNLGTLSVLNSTLSGNSANFGGGIGNRGGIGNSSRGTLSVINSTFSGNSANVGGGIRNRGELSVTNCTLSDNSADDNGGGIDNGSSGTLSVINSTLSGNSALRTGGGINILDSIGGITTLSVINSTFSGNSANIGGGIRNFNNGTLNVINCTLSGNSASSGGGIDNLGGSSTLNVINSTISANSASSGGGGIGNGISTLNVLNSTLSGNSASSGGGIYNNGTLSVLNSTLSGNSAENTGGGIFNFETLSVFNSTLSGNSASSGGGISNRETLSLANSIVAANAAVNGYANIRGPIDTNEGGNVFGTNIGGASDVFEPDPANIFDSLSDFTDLSGNAFQGGTLANNGGPVETILILEGGAAHNHQDAAALPADIFDFDGDDDLTEVLPVDARGLPRVRGALDSGALELNFFDLPVLNVPTFDQDGNPVVSFPFEPDVSGALWTLRRSTTLEDFDTVTPIFSYDGDNRVDTVGSLSFSLDSSSNGIITISVTDDTSPSDPRVFYRLEVEEGAN